MAYESLIDIHGIEVPGQEEAWDSGFQIASIDTPSQPLFDSESFGLQQFVFFQLHLQP
jgi:hypothetical protein